METYLHSAETSQLFAALVAAQAEGLIAIEASENRQVGSRYADLIAVWQTIRPILSRHKLAVTQHVGRIRREGEESVIGLRTTLAHESGQFISDYGEFIIQFIVGRNGGQGLSKTWASASAVTYLRRYGLLSILGIVTGDDDDAQQFVQSMSAEPTVPRRRAIPTPMDGPEWTKYVGGEWRAQFGPDGRPLGSYAPAELRDLVRKTVDEIGDSSQLSAMMFDRIEERLGILNEDLGPALNRRGWSGPNEPSEWALPQFRDAFNVLLAEPKQGGGQ